MQQTESANLQTNASPSHQNTLTQPNDATEGPTRSLETIDQADSRKQAHPNDVDADDSIVKAQKELEKLLQVNILLFYLRKVY